MKIPLFTLLFLVSLFQILLSIDLVLVSGQCLENQRSLLVQLKNGLTFDPSSSTKLVRWNQTSTDCCNWEGVTCNTNTGHVIGLDLNNESIAVGINSSSTLFSLQFLQRLDLASNNFSSAQIPSGLFNLTSLTYLNLSNSGFAGQIPNGFSRLTRLVILDLSSIYVFGKSSLKLENPNLTMLVQNHTELTELYLDGVNISTQGYTWSQAISSSLPNLRVLSLSNSYISGPVDSSLEKLQFLSVIRLDQNKLNAPFPHFFANYLNLTSLRLSSCNLSGTFPEQILKRGTLQNLDLSLNHLLEGSLPELPQNGSLRTLVLSYTNFSGLLPDSIGNIGMVSRMELNNCNFSGKIPNSMAKLTQLVFLDFSFNKFTGHIPSFQNSKNLTYLDLSRNELSGTIPWTHFEGLVNLVNIDLRFNAFNGSIPSLFSLPSLRKIQLSNNQFDGLLANFSTASSSQLDTLDLSSNNLNGSIPPSLFELKRLNILSLSSNKLTGLIQLETILRLANLTSLDLSYNNLSIETRRNSSGKSPFLQLSGLKLASCKLQNFPNLENQLRLSSLDLSDNQIGGQIPKWIWNIGNGSLRYLNLSRNRLVNLQKPYAIPNLSVLDLHSNHLTGEIPIPPKTAAYVDYSANSFNSSIPPDIGNNLTVAYFFSVSSNNLTGNIPESICNATYLQVLDLSNNGLSGIIPPCLLGQSDTLGVLNLGNNSLTSNISGTFGRNCGLKTLDLHANHLEGNVPQSLANCTMLEVLNLGSNQISDTFPCFLKNFSNLRVLVLRFNRFHGDIRCTPPRSHWPNLQIIDIASNYLTGKVPQNCFLNWTGMMGDKDDAELEVNHLRFEVLQLSHLYYQDTVTVTNKGLEVELVKILTIFNSIDISNNKFEGDIPETVGKLKALYLLNFSHNALTGSIPPSLQNLKQLEALDLSVNKLTGKIPAELTSLNFLSFLNLSNNLLTGMIPIGSQFQTFTETSFEGNKGLCGAQLNTTCGGGAQTGLSSAPNNQAPSSSPSFDWQFIFTGLGFGVGAAIVLGPLMFLKQGIYWWDECIDELVIMILPAFGITFDGYNDLAVEAEDDTEEEPPDSAKYSDDEGTMEDEVFGGRYCVFCSKIDMVRNTILHNPKCNCHSSTPIYSSSSSFSISSSSS